MKRGILKLSIFSFSVFLLWTVVYGLPAIYAAVPHLINYQGQLTDKNDTPLTGAQDITFRIYDAETAGTMLWEEPHTGAIVEQGIVSVLLGSIMPLNLPFDTPYFLEIKVNNDVLTPRQRITSAGYAIRSEVSESLPKGVIIMCKNSCPAGYKRITELDGKFLVSGVNYNLSAGGNNSHTHNAGGYMVSDHSHAIPWGWGNGGGGGNRDWIEEGAGAPNHQTPWNTSGSSSIRVIGTSSSADNRPEFATIILCEKE